MDTYSEIEAMHAECMVALNRMAWACADVQSDLVAVGVEAKRRGGLTSHHFDEKLTAGAQICAGVPFGTGGRGNKLHDNNNLDSFFKNDSLREGHAAEIDKISIFENLTEWRSFG